MSKKFSIKSYDDPAKFEELAPYFTEEEFETGLINILSSALAFTSWKNFFGPKTIKDLPSIVPMPCKGSNCEFANICPIIKTLRKDKDTFAENEAKLLEGDCRVDLIESVRLFIGYQKELNLDVSQGIDINTVLDLIRCQIMKRRIDWHITLDGIKLVEISAVDRYNNTFFTTKEHPLLKTSDGLEKRIKDGVKALAASRADKQKAMGKNEVLKELLSGGTVIVTKPTDRDREGLKNPIIDVDA